MSPFAQATTVEPGEQPGHYRASLTDDWRTAVVPLGGLVAAVAARAMADTLADDGLRLRSLNAVFAAPVPAGPLDVEVSVLRRGRTLAQCSASVTARGADAGLRALGVFGSSRPGFAFTDVQPPAVPPPEECPSFRDPPPPEWDRGPMSPLWTRHLEGRPAIGNPPWDDYVPTSSERAAWYRFEETPRLADGSIDPMAIVAIADTMPGAIGQRMGPMNTQWFAPSADLTVHLFQDARSEWLLASNRARHCGDGYASLEATLWDPAVGMIAYATQVAVFTFAEGPPPAHLLRPVDQR